MVAMSEHIATAPTNGLVVLWNVHFGESGKLMTNLKKVTHQLKVRRNRLSIPSPFNQEHTRMVNRIHWNPHHGRVATPSPLPSHLLARPLAALGLTGRHE